MLLRHLRTVLAPLSVPSVVSRESFKNTLVVGSVVRSISVVNMSSSSAHQLNGHSNGCPATTNGSSPSTSPSTNGTNGQCSSPGSDVSPRNLVQFLELVGNLKHLKRTGWVLRDVNDCETVAGHMYRMSLMTFLLNGSEGLDRIKCMEMALVHDLAESLVGDITPYCGVTKKDKEILEMEAIHKICGTIQHRGDHILQLFYEYEKGESAEAKFVKDLDRLDMVMQALEYEKRDDCAGQHQEFFDSTEGKFNHPMVKKMVQEIKEQRIENIKKRELEQGQAKSENQN